MAEIDEIILFKNFITQSLERDKVTEFVENLYDSESMNMSSFCEREDSESFLYNAFLWDESYSGDEFWDDVNCQWLKVLYDYQCNAAVKKPRCESIW